MGECSIMIPIYDWDGPLVRVHSLRSYCFLILLIKRIIRTNGNVFLSIIVLELIAQDYALIALLFVLVNISFFYLLKILISRSRHTGIVILHQQNVNIG
jgi:hypothetical protein